MEIAESVFLMAAAVESPAKMIVRDLAVFYGKFRALNGVNLSIPTRMITAIIGPSGCGKSTLLRSFNRMNDLTSNCRVEGEITMEGENLYAPGVDVVDIRRRVGMVFQRPNPFPKSIYDNVAYGPRLYGIHRRSDLDGIVERSLKSAALWDEIKDKLHQSGLSISDPISTLKIEELMQELKKDYTIVIVTHNMQQAARVSDFTAMMMIDDARAGRLIEYDATNIIFTRPKDKRTEDYVTGRFG
jgi:phosphate transport system ATP-binding protein